MLEYYSKNNLDIQGGTKMRKDIQPNYDKATITCVCGNVIEVGSTKKEMKTDTCSACHPFFTGQKQAVSSKGRAAKFMEKYGTNK